MLGFASGAGGQQGASRNVLLLDEDKRRKGRRVAVRDCYRGRADMMETEGKQADIRRRASSNCSTWCGYEVNWRRRSNSLVEVSVTQDHDCGR